MPLEDILPRLKTINSGVSGISTAFDHDDIPQSIQTADLPAVMVYPTPSQINYSAAQQAHIEHIVLMDVYVAPRSRRPLREQLSDAVPYVDLFVTEYADAMRLNDLDSSTPETDEYIAQLQQYEIGELEFEGDKFYIGVRFTLQVHEHTHKTTGT